jgi:hypothetical protein
MKAELVKREDHYGLYNEDGHKIAATIDGCNSKLSIKNCEAIANGYDLDELTREACDITDSLRLDSQKYKQDPYFKIGFNKGFQKALEILGDKKFTYNDIQRAFIQGVYTKNEIHSKKEEYIQSLQPTEIEVEIVMETKQQLINGYKNQPDNVVGFIAEYKDVQVPMLDKDGCLILKRI